MAQKLSLQARRWRTIIVTLPIMAATSLVLYERLVLGKPQRHLPRENEEGTSNRIVSIKPDELTTAERQQGQSSSAETR